MIDKLEVRVSAGTAFTSRFESLFLTAKFNFSRHYMIVADLRPFAYDAILHYACRHGKERNHKVELVDTAGMSHLGMVKAIEEIFAVDANRLGVMRIDLAVDVPGVSVPWFAEHARIKYKRFLAKLGVVETAEMGDRQIQTLYYGKRPNVFRIYDKLQEYRIQFQRMLRQIASDIAPPTFEQCFGVPESGHILTRVERQFGGGRIPAELASVGDLVRCAAFNPFESLELVTGGSPEPSPLDYTFTDYCAGMHLRHIARTQGMQAAIAFVIRHSKRNKKWALDKFREFLPVARDSDITAERLFELFQRSVNAQLRGPESA